MSTKHVPPFAAHFDGNQVPSLMGVEGTLGTSDTGGTARNIPVGANPATGALYVQDLAGASGTTTVQMVSGTLNVGTVTMALNTGTITTIAAGTQNTLGTVEVLNNLIKGTITKLEGGTLGALAVGTITAGTVAVTIGTIVGPTASGGTPTTAPVLVAGTDATGTVYAPLITSGGLVKTLQTGGTLTLGTLTNLVSGTINALASGTITAGTLTNLVSGTINALAAGTVTAGTLTNLVSGTVTALAVGTIGGKAASGVVAVANPVQIAGTDAGGTIYSPLVTTGGLLAHNMVTGTITTGSLTNLANLVNGSVNVLTGTITSVGTVTGVGVVSNLTNGSVNLLTGTVTSVTNLAGGTVRIDPTSVQTPLTFGTLGTAGGSFFATISAASGAGTKHYVSGLQVIGQAGTVDVRVLAGTVIQGTGVLGAGITVPGGGFIRDFNKDFQTGTNSELVYHFVGAGTAFITINYWKGA